jgi:hypothetical protein
VCCVGRVDETGAAYAGSQRQTQLWVNHHPEELQRELRAVFPEFVGARIEWRSPLASDRYREHRDRACLERLGLGEHAEALREFWPRGRPVWDALATVQSGDGRSPGVLLIEGKSHSGELYASACQAVTGSSSPRLIERSLGRDAAPARARRGEGALVRAAVSERGPAGAPVLAVRGGWRRGVARDLLFVGDPRMPASREGLNAALHQADREPGLARPCPAPATRRSRRSRPRSEFEEPRLQCCTLERI